MNRYHPAISAVASADPGDVIVIHTRDALDTDLTLDSIADDLAAVDLNLVHPMTGPVHINGAKRGDALEVELLAIDPDEYGYTLIVPGFGFLRDLYPDPYIVNWRLTPRGAVSDQMPGVTVPYEAFPGSIGVLPGEPEIQAWKAREAALAEAGGIALTPQPTGAEPASVCGPSGSHKDDCLRTIPPRENGGNMDVQQMQVGTRSPSPASWTVAPCSPETCTTPKETERCPAPPSRQARWSRCGHGSSPAKARTWRRPMSRAMTRSATWSPRASIRR